MPSSACSLADRYLHSFPTRRSSDLCGLSHSFGSSSSRFSAARRLCFASKSKIPPQLGRPGQQVGERGGNLVYAFGFHFLPPSLAQAATGQTRRAEYSSAILSSKNALGLGAAMNWR